VRIARTIGERVLRRQDEVVAIGRDELSDEPLRRPVRVVAGRVDEVAVGLDVAVEDATALLFRRAPAPVLAEGHRAQAELRDAQAASSEQGVAHRSLLCGWQPGDGPPYARTPASTARPDLPMLWPW